MLNGQEKKIQNYWEVSNTNISQRQGCFQQAGDDPCLDEKRGHSMLFVKGKHCSFMQNLGG